MATKKNIRESTKEKKDSPTNRYGANQYEMDPRQKLCWEKYIDPKSKTFGNATQSALAAGYEFAYADVITTRPWFAGKVRRLNMVAKAERNLDKALDTDWVDKEKGVQTDVMRIVMDVSKTVVTTLGKDEGYSTRSELTGKNGDAIEILTEQKELIQKALDEL